MGFYAGRMGVLGGLAFEGDFDANPGAVARGALDVADAANFRQPLLEVSEAVAWTIGLFLMEAPAIVFDCEAKGAV